MDLEALVERITEQVMKELEAGTPPAAAPSSGDSIASAGCKKLIVAESDKSGILRRLAGFGHSVVTTPGLETDAHSLGFSDVHSGRNLTDYASVLSDIREVLLPDVSLTLLSKIVNLIADTPSASVVIAALERNIPIVASLSQVSPPLAGRMVEMRRQAESMGIRFTDNAAIVSAGPSTCAFVEYRRPMAGDPDEPLGICIVRDPDTLQLFLDHGVTRFGTAMGGAPVRSPNLAQYIDHTLLKPETTRADIEKLCKEAAEYKFASVCVNPSWVVLCVEQLRGSGVKVCTVIGFPLGATTTATKVAETQEAIRAGAEEIDMVINVGALKAGDHKTVSNDIASVKRACGNMTLKVIFETGLLTDEEKMTACQLCVEAGADFVKTSTGFGPGGATLSDIALMRRVVGPNIGVKASGGVRDTKTAQQMIEMGATRIGASAGIAIVKGEKAKGSGY